MTLPELKALPTFKLLQPKEQAWMIEYATNGGDPDAAARKAFDTHTDSLTRRMARKMMTEPRLVPVIALWNGQLEDEPSIDEYRHELWRMARECSSDAARAALMRLYGEARGFIKRGLIHEKRDINADLLQEIENPSPKKEKK